MPDSKMEELKSAINTAQTIIARILGSRRIGVLKTAEIAKNVSENIKDDCEKFAQMATVAQQIQKAAVDGGFSNIERKARSCKMTIKAEYEKYVKEMSKPNHNHTLSSGHLSRVDAEIKKLLSQLQVPLQNMVEIYNTSITTYNSLNAAVNLEYIEASIPPSAPPLPLTYTP